MFEKLLDVTHIVIEPKLSIGQWDHACIDPVRYIDFMVWKQCTHGVAQKCGVVSRHGREHQELWIRLALFIRYVAFEMNQVTKRQAQIGLDRDANMFAVHLCSGQTPAWFFVFFPEAMNKFIPCRHLPCHRCVGEGAGRVGEQFGAQLGKVRKGRHHGTVHFMKLIKHVRFQK